jgi:O-methyltransferase
MKELDLIWDQQLFETQRSYTQKLALTVQPQCHTRFGLHPEFDEVFRLWTQGWAWYGLDKSRLWGLILNLKRILAKREGAMAEVGVYKGNCGSVLSYYARQFGRRLYLCDTFEGFDPSQFEEDMGPGKIGAFKDTSLESARANVGDYSGNRWIVGMFPASVTPEMARESYAFVHLDCDIYEPTIEGLKFFWPRMSVGGAIWIHDYDSGHWPGATKAVDEFCAAERIEGVLLPDACGSILLTKQA